MSKVSDMIVPGVWEAIEQANKKSAGLPAAEELKRPSTEEMEQAALRRALDNKSSANYATIISEFSDRGIPSEDVIPRENVFTYKAWRAKGRQVKKGERGVGITTLVEGRIHDETKDEYRDVRYHRTATVFHISQTIEIGTKEEEPMSNLVAGPRRQSKFQATGLVDEELYAPANEGLADTLIKLAQSAGTKADLLSKPMTQRTTPKRLQQHSWNLCQSAEYTVTEIALRSLAELHRSGRCPKPLARMISIEKVRKQVALKFHSRPNGFNQIYEVTGEYSNDEPEAKLMQSIIEYVREELRARVAAGSSLNKAQIDAKDRELASRGYDGFFPTPPHAASVVVGLADIQDGHEVLEPSAGVGSLAEAVREAAPGAVITCIEKVKDLGEQCQAKGFDTYIGDCMAASGEFDRIVMNPPFEHNEYIRHVMHCFTMLKPGGVLVAIVPVGYEFQQSRTAKEFREWLDWHQAATPRRNCTYFSDPTALRQTSVAVNVIRIVYDPVAAGDE